MSGANSFFRLFAPAMAANAFVKERLATFCVRARPSAIRRGKFSRLFALTALTALTASDCDLQRICLFVVRRCFDFSR
jgi:hypothetical protein